ncbi:MAG: response regulator, partial [Bacteriovoracaceae bacterium]
ILLVDDEKDLVMTLSAILKKWGYSVVTASDGVGAQKILEETAVDVILSDLIMPNMDGGELLTWLNSQKKKPHFIIMSAYYNEGFIKYFSDQGITNILGKPIQFDKLQSMLKKISSNSESEPIPPQENLASISPEPVVQVNHSVYERIMKDISERLPEAKHIVIVHPQTGAIYSVAPQNTVFVASDFSRSTAVFFSAVHTLWASVCSENRSPKEILSFGDDDIMVYRNIVSPDVCIYVEATTEMTHGLLRVTIENVMKDISFPIPKLV